MIKIKRLSALAVFAAFSIVAILAVRALGQARMAYLHADYIVIAQMIITFLLGMLLNSVHKKLIFSFRPYYFVVSLVCLALIIALYAFYGVLPAFFALNISYIQSFLSLYAGANLFSALFGNKKRQIADNISLKSK